MGYANPPLKPVSTYRILRRVTGYRLQQFSPNDLYFIERSTAMGILSWILVGIVAGWLAGLVMRGGYGILGNMILGIIGALVGGFLASNLFGVADPVSGFNLTTLIIAFLGAVLVVAIVRALPGRSPV
jgi:uncharacterized membrane protein YeaQ/YmgE (transglycosylase-associated protein family)